MKFLHTLTLPATRWQTAWNIRFWIVLVFFTLVASITRAQTSTAFSGFTESFNPAGSNIVFTTTNARDFFYVGNPIGLATIDGSPLNVYAWYGDLVYSGPATNLYLPAGHYFVEAPGDRNEFAVLPADWSTLSNVGFDGSPWPDPVVLAVASFLKLGWVRGGGAWDQIQAAGSNSWDWTVTDQIVAAHHGLRKIEIDLDGEPSWMTDASNGAWTISASQFAQLFAQFAQAAAQRYSNLVDVVEVWNEPSSYDLPLTNLTDQAALYTNMLAATRSAFPSTVKISGPVFNSAFMLAQAQGFAAAGAGPYLDYDVFHDYEARNGAPDVDITTNPVWCTIPQRIQNNFAIYAKPIVVDEVGLYGVSALGAPNPAPLPGIVENSGMSWTTGMTYAVKYAVMYAANNAILMPHLILTGSDVTNNDEVLGFDANGRGPHPKTSAFLMGEYWVNGSTLVDWLSPGTNIFLYAWQRPDNTSIVFAWATDGQSFPLSTSTAFTITDVYGRSIQPSVLDAQPVIFHTNSPNAMALLNAVLAALPGSSLPPIMGLLGNQNVLINQALQFTVPATDPNNYAITYSANSLPTGATLDPATGIFSWIPGESQAGVYSIAFTATDAVGLSASTTTMVSVLDNEMDGLVGWWKFDETSGTIAADSAGSNPGTLLGFGLDSASGWTTGIIGGALAFDGTNAYVNLDNCTLSLTNNFSVSAWINPRDADAGDGVYFCLRSTYGTSGFRFNIADNNLIIGGVTPSGWHLTYFALGQIQNNIWSHIVVVYDKSTLEVYLNGTNVPAAYSGDPNWGGDFLMNTSGVSRIGAEFGSGPVGYLFNGLIDDVRVYNRTLIPAEVLALYQAAEEPPVLAPISAQTVVAGQLLTFTLSGSDPNTSNLTYSAGALPSGATLNTATGLFSWTPNGTQTGVYDVTFTASDGQLTNSQATTITVFAVASVTVHASPSNAGTVSGGGTYAVGSQQQLTANPASGWGFTSWSDGNTQNPRTITVLSGSATYTADFNQGTTPITVQASPSNTGTVSGGGTYAVGSQQQLTANPASGWGFASWSDGNTQNPRTITVPSGGATYTADFSQATTPITVQASPSNTGTVSGGGTYAVGSQQQLTANPASGWGFTNWSDGNMQNPRTITVPSGGTTYTADFSRQSTSGQGGSSNGGDGATLQITSVPTVINPAAQIGSLTVVVAGDTNVFTVDATDSGGATLYYTWTFGDGQTSARSSTNASTHVYEDCGPYTANVVVDDGVSSTNASLAVSTACLLGRLGLHVTLNFARTNSDSCTVSGTCDLPADYNFTNNVVTLDIAGAEVAFTLNSKRHGVSGLNTFTVSSYNKRTGLWTFNVTLRDGSWSSLWNSYGLVNATVLKPGVAVALPVVLAINNETFMATTNLHYTAVAGRSGTAR